METCNYTVTKLLHSYFEEIDNRSSWKFNSTITLTTTLKNIYFVTRNSLSLWSIYTYEIRLSHIFEIPSISNEKPGISVETPSISIGNFRFRSKYWVFRIKYFEILGFEHYEREILSISCKRPSISKSVKSLVFSGLYVCPLASASVVNYAYVFYRRLFGKCNTPAQFD